MFGIDDPTAVAVLPTPEAAGTVGFWTEGNPALGQAATLMRASFFNGLQQELLNILAAAGITPSKTTYNQLLAAINVLNTGRILRILKYYLIAGVQNVSINGGAPTTSGAGTYTASAGIKYAIADVQGAGAAGAGGAQITTSGNASMGAPGACGSFGRGLFLAAAIGASQTITVGAGGTGISGASGNAGGVSSFGALLSAAGGPSGGALNNFVASALANGNSNLSAAPSGANLWGSQGSCEGQSMIINAGTGSGFLPGTGGRSVYGVGGFGALNTTPVAAASPGSGGGGVIILNGFGPFAGGKGADGQVIITEYA